MIYLICNNANSKRDGIGDYSYNLYRALQRNQCNDICICSANSGLNGRLEKLFSVKMSKVFSNVSHKIKHNDVVIIEYPFIECNIFILFFLWKLKIAVKRNNGFILLSLHEYGRVNFYRKFIIRHFISSADSVLVTDEQAMSWISNKYKKPVSLRTIPSNIFEKPKFELKKSRYVYVYFGLITKAKAIDEMMQAWIKFNTDNKYTLYFLTSSQFTNQYEEFGVKYLQNLDNVEIIRYFCLAGFCILPIIPYVSINNASFKTSLLYQCIPIGCFNKELDSNNFISICGNEVDDILKGLIRSQELSESEYIHKLSIIKKLPQASFDNTASQYIEAIRRCTEDSRSL